LCTAPRARGQRPSRYCGMIVASFVHVLHCLPEYDPWALTLTSRVRRLGHEATHRQYIIVASLIRETMVLFARGSPYSIADAGRTVRSRTERILSGASYIRLSLPELSPNYHYYTSTIRAFAPHEGADSDGAGTISRVSAGAVSERLGDVAFLGLKDIQRDEPEHWSVSALSTLATTGNTPDGRSLKV